MTYAQKLKKRENRRKKRQIRHQLIMQAKNNKGIAPVGKFVRLNKSFPEYVVSETKRELLNEMIATERAELLKKVIELKDKLNPKRKEGLI